jgi:hypothetical protein
MNAKKTTTTAAVSYEGKLVPKKTNYHEKALLLHQKLTFGNQWLDATLSVTKHAATIEHNPTFIFTLSFCHQKIHIATREISQFKSVINALSNLMDQKAHLIEQTLLKEQQTHDKWFQQWSEQRELRIIHQKRQEMSTKELFDL